METWVKIKHVCKEGYFVSDLGRIKVIKNGSETVKVGSLRQDGYRIIATGKKTYFLVHILVIENFENRPEWAECINHKNGIKDDNRLENLEYSTLKLNNLHAYQTGLNKTVGNFGESHHNSRDISEIHKIYDMKSNGAKLFEVRRAFPDRSYSSIRRVFNGTDWKYEFKKRFGVWGNLKEK